MLRDFGERASCGLSREVSINPVAMHGGRCSLGSVSSTSSSLGGFDPVFQNSSRV
jgi:hypothetical protein